MPASLPPFSCHPCGPKARRMEAGSGGSHHSPYLFPLPPLPKEAKEAKEAGGAWCPAFSLPHPPLRPSASGGGRRGEGLAGEARQATVPASP